MGDKLVCNIPSVVPVPSFNHVIIITSNYNIQSHKLYTICMDTVLEIEIEPDLNII